MRRLLLSGLVSAIAALVVAASAASASWTVHGAGFGHGVGMSAYGAYGYGKHGADYHQIIGHYFRHLRITRADRDSSVRVLLDTVGEQRFSGARRACQTKLKPSRTYAAVLSGSKVRLAAENGSPIKRCGHHLRADGRRPIRLAGLGPYRGAVDFIAGSSSLEVVNQVPVDDYAQGSVPAEVPASWPLETLKAMAVACRSIGLSSDLGGRDYDVYSDTRSQLYRGVKVETKRSNRAVAATARQVATYKGAVAQTTYFSSSGGRTESRFLGGPHVPYLESVKDPYDYYSPLHRWTVHLSDSEMDSRLGGSVDGHLRKIKVTKRGDSPRIVTAKLIGTGGTTTIDGDSLAGALGLYDRWAFFHHSG